VLSHLFLSARLSLVFPAIRARNPRYSISYAGNVHELLGFPLAGGILTILQGKGRTGVAEIGEEMGLSASA
jgi:hypothetical protein